ncbi:protein-disulfide isomerase [Symbiobacterium terraclitae]|uniref:Protein-disulfide isomerase n=1 Tax=Symbiobacterium terraclitae TaxID=557451 RepID=A0ABS4JWX1_9FIRM|nr:thioredoxin domain-containing protein [Symbiobacterium terraclitae]MBP2018964.1 protein-disulfide isomerase [Symbiobacterium terraclitae]
MSKTKERRRPYRKRDNSLWWIVGIAVGATALLIVLSNISAGRLGDIIVPETILTDQELGADRNVRGSADAPVELVEFSDFRCPACMDANSVLSSYISQLVDEGTARFVHKHMLVIDRENTSLNAAEAAECAADQGYYWAFHDMLFANQPAQGTKWSRDAMKQYAKALGLDTGAFNQCMDSQKYREKVLADSAEGYGTPGITGTPSFLVNGTLLRLQRSYLEVVDAVQAAAGLSTGQAGQ